MGLHYLIFTRTNLENGKRLMWGRTMNIVVIGNKNLVTSVGIFSNNDATKSIFKG